MNYLCTSYACASIARKSGFLPTNRQNCEFFRYRIEIFLSPRYECFAGLWKSRVNLMDRMSWKLVLQGFSRGMWGRSDIRKALNVAIFILCHSFFFFFLRLDRIFLGMMWWKVRLGSFYALKFFFSVWFLELWKSGIRKLSM